MYHLSRQVFVMCQASICSKHFQDQSTESRDIDFESWAKNQNFAYMTCRCMELFRLWFTIPLFQTVSRPRLHQSISHFCTLCDENLDQVKRKAFPYCLKPIQGRRFAISFALKPAKGEIEKFLRLNCILLPFVP